MRLVALLCPVCGGGLPQLSRKEEAVCSYCKISVRVDNEGQLRSYQRIAAGLRALHSHDAQEAERQFTSAMEQDPGNSAPLCWKAIALALQGKFSKADGYLVSSRVPEEKVAERLLNAIAEGWEQTKILLYDTNGKPLVGRWGRIFLQAATQLSSVPREELFTARLAAAAAAFGPDASADACVHLEAALQLEVAGSLRRASYWETLASRNQSWLLPEELLWKAIPYALRDQCSSNTVQALLDACSSIRETEDCSVVDRWCERMLQCCALDKGFAENKFGVFYEQTERLVRLGSPGRAGVWLARFHDAAPATTAAFLLKAWECTKQADANVVARVLAPLVTKDKLKELGAAVLGPLGRPSLRKAEPDRVDCYAEACKKLGLNVPEAPAPQPVPVVVETPKNSVKEELPSAELEEHSSRPPKYLVLGGMVLLALLGVYRFASAASYRGAERVQASQEENIQDYPQQRSRRVAQEIRRYETSP